MPLLQIRQPGGLLPFIGDLAEPRLVVHRPDGAPDAQLFGEHLPDRAHQVADEGTAEQPPEPLHS
ncbi:hypothetical protein D3C83_213870 [compost metagenome]